MVILSIIIPVYNVEKYVEKCILSCAKQGVDSREFEIVVVNDGTPDNSMAVVEPLVKKYDNIRVVNRKNGGLSAARNTGLANAIGKYVWYVDSDDWIDESAIVTLIPYMNKNYDIITFEAANVFGDRVVKRNDKSDISDKEMTGLKLSEHASWAQCVPFNIYRRSFLTENKLTMYEGILHEDSEFEPRAYFFAKKAIAVDKILYFVRQNPQSITRTFNPNRAFDRLKVANSLDSFYKKYHDKLLLKLIANQIALNLNGIISNYRLLDNNNKRILSNQLRNNRAVFNYYLYSPKMHHRLQGLAFILCFRNTTLFMNLFSKLKEIHN